MQRNAIDNWCVNGCLHMHKCNKNRTGAGGGMGVVAEIFSFSNLVAISSF